MVRVFERLVFEEVISNEQNLMVDIFLSLVLKLLCQFVDILYFNLTV